MRMLLAIHAALILLASTAFTAFTALLGGHSLQWSFYSYSFRSGFGPPYVSDYSTAVVLTYLVAFAFGAIGFTLAYRNGRVRTGILGVILSVIGLLSFAVELSHVFVDHHRSWIVIAPMAMLALALIACLPQRDAIPHDFNAVST
ncbi:hypothetical protein [Aporhodopirellula aestuarii]|uniref:DUF998 domain-containing protein n=1 Tax=Aporhodopirellula aestuarii TaxID=2950107 RepID=A0ABT0U2R0_9BACT|nr:hypothetical protein [Aporhodopirellula aestuarii]MCM2370944.1 hypothetical protein [Aporhodopirellula aestuarii]